MSAAETIGTEPQPTPSELVQIAVALGGESKLLGGDEAADIILGDALRVWRLARDVVRRGGASEEIQDRAMRSEVARIASEEGKRYMWGDESVCRDVFGKNDSAAAEPGKLAAVSPDAIRHQLRGAFGLLGNAVFYWVKHHGITAGAADTLKHWIAGVREQKHPLESYSASAFATQLLGDQHSDDPALNPSVVAKTLADYVERG